jgi:hypothetical protein
MPTTPRFTKHFPNKKELLKITRKVINIRADKPFEHSGGRSGS